MTPAPATLDGEAEYQDGQQARPLWLRARLTSSVLELRRAGGEAVASWPVSSLRVVDRAGGVLRLAPDGSDARLLVSDAELVAALEAAQRLRRRAATVRRLRMAALAAVAVPAAALGLWKGWPPAADAIARAVPVEWERSVGAATAAAVIGGGRVCDAPEGRAALDALVAKLAAAGGMAATAPVRARVVDDPTVNALAAPGGEILVYRGLLDRAASADELAGVLAHEIGHVEHRHGLRGVARAAGLFVLTGALSGGSDAVALAAVLVGLSYSRDFEREADASGARILAAPGSGRRVWRCSSRAWSGSGRGRRDRSGATSAPIRPTATAPRRCAPPNSPRLRRRRCPPRNGRRSEASAGRRGSNGSGSGRTSRGAPSGRRGHRRARSGRSPTGKPGPRTTGKTPCATPWPTLSPRKARSGAGDRNSG
jgi:hypothetical protein